MIRDVETDKDRKRPQAAIRAVAPRSRWAQHSATGTLPTPEDDDREPGTNTTRGHYQQTRTHYQHIESLVSPPFSRPAPTNPPRIH